MKWDLKLNERSRGMLDMQPTNCGVQGESIGRGASSCSVGSQSRHNSTGSPERRGSVAVAEGGWEYILWERKRDLQKDNEKIRRRVSTVAFLVQVLWNSVAEKGSTEEGGSWFKFKWNVWLINKTPGEIDEGRRKWIYQEKVKYCDCWWEYPVCDRVNYQLFKYKKKCCGWTQSGGLFRVSRIRNII